MSAKPNSKAAYFPFAFLRLRLEDKILVNREGRFDQEGDDFKYFYRRLVWIAIEQYVLPKWKEADEECGEDETAVTFSAHSDDLDLWHDKAFQIPLDIEYGEFDSTYACF